jgi:hypothetical protein
MEYLEPSAVGVRIGHTSAPDQSSTKGAAPSLEKIDSLAPHAMILGSFFQLDKDFSQYEFRYIPESFYINYFSNEIFRPPLLST